MSKTTKIVAALGIVAGLGVAALPAFTYAAQTPASTTGDVDVVVEVQPAIAMTITGNNDDGSHYGTPTEYTDVSPEGSENPSELHWYERTGTGTEQDPYVYTPTGDTEVEFGKAYATKTGTYNPVDSFAPSTIAGGVLDYHNIPGFSITGTSSSYTSLTPNSTSEGGDFKSTVTVYTNANDGYTLTVIDKDDNADLVQDVATGTPKTISPISAAGALVPGTAAWGYRLAGNTDWLPMPVTPTSGTATPAQIGTENVKTDHGTTYNVEYGVATAADQATGIYKDTIVYTATTK